MKRSRPHKPFGRIADFGSDLKGLGGIQTSKIKALRGSTFGPASEGRKLTEAERKEIERKLKEEGKI